MSLEEAIKHCNEVIEQCTVYFQTNDKEVTQIPSQCASDHRQLANWLQELKERREKEQRCEEVIRDPDAKYVTTYMTEEACEAMIKLIEKVIEILPDIIASVTANMPEAIEQYIESKIRNGKEESK